MAERGSGPFRSVGGTDLFTPADTLRLYYGAADTAIGMATARFSAALDHVRGCPAPDQRRSDDRTAAELPTVR